ncbi:MAG: alpha/beta fold hydrolase [Pseudorhodoplanes sp.]
MRHAVVGLATLLIAIAVMQVTVEASMIEEPWSAGGLHGTLARSAKGPERGPAVLIIAGSGPTDRNGNGPQLSTDTYRKLAEGLAASGIRSLRYDKRGIGESRAMAEREENVTFEDFISDAVAAAKLLSQRPDVSGVVLAGHSEGAIIALAAAPRVQASGIVLLCSPGRDLLSVLRAQLKGRLPPDLDTSANAILDALASGNRVADIPQSLQAIFRPSVQPFLISAGRFDPAKLIVGISMPVLALHAGRDLQVVQADLDALRAARSDLRFVVLPEGNHTLKASPKDPEGNLALYRDPAAPLDPGVLPPIVGFVRDVTR